MSAATPEPDLPIIIREMSPDDLHLVLDSWVKGYRGFAFAVPSRSGRWDGQSPLPTRLYLDEHERLVRDILDRSHTLVATRPEDPDQILGWLCYEPALLHYVYVKTIYRGWGIARRMLGRANITRERPAVFSHRTSHSDQKLKSRMAVFNPYRAWR